MLGIPSLTPPVELRRTLLFSLALLALACGGPSDGGSTTGDAVPPASGGEATAGDRPGSPGDDDAPATRVLALDATFADLVGQAAALAEAGQGDEDLACLLRAAPPTGGAHRLEADLAPAIRPLPRPPAGTTATLRQSPPPTALTVWGRFGGRGADGPVLATFTTAPPPEPGDLVVSIPAQGAPVERPLTGAPPAEAEAEDAAPGGSAPGSGNDGGPTDAGPTGERAPAVVLTADAETPVRRMLDVMASHEDDWGEVVLAVLLPEGTRLPPPRTANVDEDPAQAAMRCPDGLPAPSGPVGELPVDVVRSGIAPLVEATSGCTGQATGAVAGGGLLEIELRVTEDGRVDRACAATDEIGDPGFRACVLEAAEALRFPRPSPRGEVDVAVPLRIPEAAGLRQRPLCSGPSVRD